MKTARPFTNTATSTTSRAPAAILLLLWWPTKHKLRRYCHRLTAVTQKPNVELEQASSSCSFRSPELKSAHLKFAPLKLRQPRRLNVIDPKTNSLSKASHPPQPKSLIKGHAAIAFADSAVQTRAYELYELHGRIDGRAEQDWYQAETDLRAGSEHA